MKTIGFVVPHLDGGGGVPAVARFLLKVAIESGMYRVKIVSLATAATHPLHTQLRKPWTLLREVGSSEGAWEGHTFTTVGARAGEVEFMRYLPRNRLRETLNGCDMIQVVAGTPAWARPVIGLGVPVSLHVATLTRVERTRKHAVETGALAAWRKLMTACVNRLDEFALRHIDAIEAQNPWLADHARKANLGRPGVIVQYAPPGIDTNFFKPAAEYSAKTSKYLLCVGRMDDPRKNTDLLLRAFALLAADDPELELWTAGSAPPEDKYFEKARKVGLEHRVKHIQRPSDAELRVIHQQAAVFVSSSAEEGFGVAIVEAMACGVPVVSTRSGGPDGYIVDGENGFLVNLDDEREMAAKIGLLLRDGGLRAKLGKAGRETATDRFSNEVAGKTFLRIWSDLTARE